MRQKQPHKDNGQSQELTNNASNEKQNSYLPPEEAIPGVPIVRSNTPRPVSFETMVSASGFFSKVSQENSAPIPVFPTKAPSAPPLPEEIVNHDASTVPATSLPPVRTSSRARASDAQQEFIWLFEYGLEMDAAILNSPERLAGSALLYGPAVLKGYRVVLGAQRIYGSAGPTIIAIIPTSEPDAEVWGILYRVPRRVTEQQEQEPSLLDTIHAAITPQNFFQGVQVVVHETFRDRDITGVTYVATEAARQQLDLVPTEQWHGDTALLQRLSTIAKKQKLPESYVSQYEVLSHSAQIVQATFPISNPGISNINISHSGFTRLSSETTSAQQNEHNTEPIPAFRNTLLPAADLVPKSVVPQPTARANRWLIGFSLYLVVLLLISLTFAILQGLGFWSEALSSRFTPLGVPWLVMMYGLLGGCISSIVTLGRFRADCPPAFVIITWFTRPFIGAVLAVMSYLLLTSGFFAFGSATSGTPPSNHIAFFLLAGMLAGLGEGWIFFKRG